MDISPEDEADIRAFVDARSNGPMPMGEFTERLRSFAARGLLGRYQELRAGSAPRPTLPEAVEEWYVSPEFERVRSRLVELSGSEEDGGRLARSDATPGVAWIFEGRSPSLDTDRVAALIWRRRHLFDPVRLGDALAWAQPRERLEPDEQ